VSRFDLTDSWKCNIVK